MLGPGLIGGVCPIALLNAAGRGAGTRSSDPSPIQGEFIARPYRQ